VSNGKTIVLTIRSSYRDMRLIRNELRGPKWRVIRGAAIILVLVVYIPHL